MEPELILGKWAQQLCSSHREVQKRSFSFQPLHLRTFLEQITKGPVINVSRVCADVTRSNVSQQILDEKKSIHKRRNTQKTDIKKTPSTKSLIYYSSPNSDSAIEILDRADELVDSPNLEFCFDCDSNAVDWSRNEIKYNNSQKLAKSTPRQVSKENQSGFVFEEATSRKKPKKRKYENSSKRKRQTLGTKRAKTPTDNAVGNEAINCEKLLQHEKSINFPNFTMKDLVTILYNGKTDQIKERQFVELIPIPDRENSKIEIKLPVCINYNLKIDLKSVGNLNFVPVLEKEQPWLSKTTRPFEDAHYTTNTANDTESNYSKRDFLQNFQLTYSTNSEVNKRICKPSRKKIAEFGQIQNTKFENFKTVSANSITQRLPFFVDSAMDNVEENHLNTNRKKTPNEIAGINRKWTQMKGNISNSQEQPINKTCQRMPIRLSSGLLNYDTTHFVTLPLTNPDAKKLKSAPKKRKRLANSQTDGPKNKNLKLKKAKVEEIQLESCRNEKLIHNGSYFACLDMPNINDAVKKEDKISNTEQVSKDSKNCGTAATTNLENTMAGNINTEIMVEPRDTILDESITELRGFNEELKFEHNFNAQRSHDIKAETSLTFPQTIGKDSISQNRRFSSSNSSELPSMNGSLNEAKVNLNTEKNDLLPNKAVIIDNILLPRFEMTTLLAGNDKEKEGIKNNILSSTKTDDDLMLTPLERELKDGLNLDFEYTSEESISSSSPKLDDAITLSAIIIEDNKTDDNGRRAVSPLNENLLRCSPLDCINESEKSERNDGIQTWLGKAPVTEANLHQRTDCDPPNANTSQKYRKIITANNRSEISSIPTSKHNNRQLESNLPTNQVVRPNSSVPPRHVKKRQCANSFTTPIDKTRTNGNKLSHGYKVAELLPTEKQPNCVKSPWEILTNANPTQLLMEVSNPKENENDFQLGECSENVNQQQKFMQLLQSANIFKNLPNISQESHAVPFSAPSMPHNQNILKQLVQIFTNFSLNKSDSTGAHEEYINRLENDFEIAKFFRISCFPSLVEKCEFRCGFSHELRDIQSFQLALRQLNMKQVNALYKFTYKHRIIYVHYFDAFCEHYCQNKQVDSLCRVLQDCQRYRKYFGQISVKFFHYFLKCGLKKQEAAEIVLEHTVQRTNDTINELMQIIVESNWILFLKHVEKFLQEPNVALHCSIIEKMTESLPMNVSSHALRTFCKCCCSINSNEMLELSKILAKSHLRNFFNIFGKDVQKHKLQSAIFEMSRTP